MAGRIDRRKKHKIISLKTAKDKGKFKFAKEKEDKRITLGKI
jgi:hypothetical protein